MLKTRSLLWASALCAGVLLLLALALAARRGGEPTVGTSFLMNTVVEYKLYGKHAEQAKDAVEAALKDIESRMSLYIDDSEIARLNAKAGEGYVPLSSDTFELLSRCVEYGKASGGVFDVTVAPLTELWGITTEHPRVPDARELSEMLGLIDYRDILLNTEAHSAMLARPGQAADVGGIAKGFACDTARQVALENGVTAGYISIGGNLMIIGDKPDGEPFRFGVRDPRGTENDYLAVVTLKDSTMATSGDYERFFEQDGIRYHHILDPATGAPAQTDLMSVSVVTPDGAYADFMSTYLFIKGKEFAVEHLDAFDCGLVVVDKDKNVYVSKSLRGQFTPADETGTYRFEGLS